MVGIVSVFGILMYNIRPYLFCGGEKRGFKVALVIAGTCCELLTCISVVLSVGGGVKGTLKLRLSLKGPPPIPNVSTSLFFFFLGRGGG